MLLQLPPQLVFADAAVVEERADLVDEEVVDPLAQLVEDGIRGRTRRMSLRWTSWSRW